MRGTAGPNPGNFRDSIVVNVTSCQRRIATTQGKWFSWNRTMPPQTSESKAHAAVPVSCIDGGVRDVHQGWGQVQAPVEGSYTSTVDRVLSELKPPVVRTRPSLSSVEA